MLDQTVKKKLLDCAKQLNVEGKLFSLPQLDELYATFRSHFGPDKLASIDGETLLETMHAHGGKDSLVYWLEFKNDEEFPSVRFGSIAGGSAFKFGIFRRKETGTWVTTGEGNVAKDISVDEAIGFARKHRDQLLHGVEEIRQVPANGSDADYRHLQECLDKVAPDVSDLAWGHKYFHLMFPDKLDDYHSAHLQRFELLKLLQEPPEGKGRYVCAGRYVALAAELGMSMNSLTTVVWTVNGGPHRYWRIGTSDGDAPRNQWGPMKDGNNVAIGWSNLGDLSSLERNQKGKDELQQLVEKHAPSTPQAMGRTRNQIFAFVTTIAAGDYVLAADGATVIGVGRVTGEYVYNPTAGFSHQLPVQWLTIGDWKMPEPEGLQTTVYEVKNPKNIIEAERRTHGAPPPTISVITSQAGPAPRLAGIPGRIQSVLERKSQVILYGPPGTGKTYWAEKAACDLAAYALCGKPFDQLSDSDKVSVTGQSQSSGLVRLCCFHPAYGYEDFIEGYRPETPNGQMTFRLRDGFFKRVCREAEAATQRRYYLIIDEINRGDIPRIFGELLTVLEKDKRGKGIVLPVSGEVLRIPENVFVIGTMNTADRSISLLDTALRRRFGFVELPPDSSLFKDHVISGIPLGPWLDALNRRICQHVGRDARNLQIGHSYLLHGGRPVKEMAAFKRIIRDDILPLVEEYCYEDFVAFQNIVGKGLLDLKNGRIRHELFEDGQEQLLVQALLEPSHEEVTANMTAVSKGLAEGESSDGDEGGGAEET